MSLVAPREGTTHLSGEGEIRSLKRLKANSLKPPKSLGLHPQELVCRFLREDFVLLLFIFIECRFHFS
jgi:hypothetical protein